VALFTVDSERGLLLVRADGHVQLQRPEVMERPALELREPLRCGKRAHDTNLGR
jgi:hypothetical protein